MEKSKSISEIDKKLLQRYSKAVDMYVGILNYYIEVNDVRNIRITADAFKDTINCILATVAE